jgi:hypothetical protein
VSFPDSWPGTRRPREPGENRRFAGEKSASKEEESVAADGLNLDRISVFRQFPGLRILSAIRLAFDLRKVIVAAAGLVLLQLGWSILDWMLPRSADVTPELSWVVGPLSSYPRGFGWTTSLAAFLTGPLLEPFRLVIEPLWALVKPGSAWVRMLHGFLALLWLFLIWGICGGAIARIALVQIAKQQQLAIAEAFRFGLRFTIPLSLAPLCPLLGILGCGLVAALFGAIYRVPVVGPTVGGILLFVPLLLGLVMMMLAIGLVASWPFLHVAVAAGADDALDALSRSFSYLSQRLGALAILLFPIALQGIVGLALVELLAAGVTQTTAWSLGLTAPFDMISPLVSDGGNAGGIIAMSVHAFWLAVVRLLAHGWVYSFTWSTAALVYLWLRNDVDSLPWTEIDLPVALTFPMSSPIPTEQAPAPEAGGSPPGP